MFDMLAWESALLALSVSVVAVALGLLSLLSWVEVRLLYGLVSFFLNFLVTLSL